jgi:hypothetical protein
MDQLVTELRRLLVPDAVRGSTVEVALPDRGTDVASARSVAYLGLYDLVGARLSVEDAVALRRSIEDAEGPLRFQLHEQRSEIELLERAARMDDRESETTEGWMLPKLRAEILRYRERIEALTKALEATG